MKYSWHAHRFADIILNSDYELKQEIELVIQTVKFDDVLKRFEDENANRRALGKKEAKGKQSTINLMFGENFQRRVGKSKKTYSMILIMI